MSSDTVVGAVLVGLAYFVALVVVAWESPARQAGRHRRDLAWEAR